MTFTFFKSIEDMFEEIHRMRIRADSLVNPTQTSIKPGQYFINFKHDLGFPIFGQILDYRKLGINESEQEYVNEIYEQPHMLNFKPSKAYSIACEQGEIGDIHLSSIGAIIDAELFNFYKQNNWTKPYSEVL